MESLSPTRNRSSPFGGLGRFIPPAARRPATAIPAVLVMVTLVYVFWSAINPITLLYDDVVDTTSTPDSLYPNDKPVGNAMPDIDHGSVGKAELPISLSLNPSLDQLCGRLVQFLHRPVLSHEEAEESNRLHCPLEISDKLVNPDQYNGDSGFWKNEVTKEVIVEKRLGLVNFLADRVEQGERIVWEEGLGKGRGIVMTAGNKVCLLLRLTQTRLAE